MPAADFLKSFRGKGYENTPGKGPEMEKEEGHSRTLSLTDDEKKYFEGAPPGEDVACEVHGKLSPDGKLMVMTISPMGQPQGGENEMAGQVAQKVMPGMNV